MSKGPMRSPTGPPGKAGSLRPSDALLKVRFCHAAPAANVGKRYERAWRTRARASSTRRSASATIGASPAPWRTASAKERRSGAVGGVWAASGAAASASAANDSDLVFRDAMEIQVDVGVEVAAHRSEERRV